MRHHGITNHAVSPRYRLSLLVSVVWICWMCDVGSRAAQESSLAASRHITDAERCGALGCYWRRIWSLTGWSVGPFARAVISIADVGFCRLQFQQTQGSPLPPRLQCAIIM